MIWGNHSATQVPDAQLGVILNHPQPGLTTPVKGAVCDDKWVNNEYIDSVAKRGAAII